MKLYVTPTSSYARLAFIVRLENGLADKAELIWTRTRNPNDPVLAVNFFGRIPATRKPTSSSPISTISCPAPVRTTRQRGLLVVPPASGDGAQHA